MKKYKNKYRIPSARLPSWDYSWAGSYFVTICTANREHFFGEIIHNKMKLSPIGAIAIVLWQEIKNHKKNIELGPFTMMPNHIRGILILNNNHDLCNNDFTIVETLHATSLHQQPPHHHPQKNEFMSSIAPKSNSLSTTIRSYKSAVTKHARQLGFNFAWQDRFYDHIIRNHKSFDKISEYIVNNPADWESDEFYEQDE